MQLGNADALDLQHLDCSLSTAFKISNSILLLLHLHLAGPSTLGRVSQVLRMALRMRRP